MPALTSEEQLTFDVGAALLKRLSGDRLGLSAFASVLLRYLPLG